MAQFTLASLRRLPACRAAVRLVLLLVALRALLPVGYMPDFGGLEDGQVRIVICTGAGPQALLVDATGRPIDEGGGAARLDADGDCVFGVIAAATVALPLDGPAFLRRDRAANFPSMGAGHAPSPSVRGPALGSRAPPAFLG